MYTGKYWEDEQAQIVDTGKNVMRFFPKAEKLQVSMPYWTDKDGTQKPGKTITLDVKAIRETPEAVELLKQILAEKKSDQ
ncbi:MAG: hypothetical protein LBQ90_04150 [Synergistaceae bacterium]|jgi:hypothetical protein|nr:hypothetical protein [Synergistaceae bacterium]